MIQLQFLRAQNLNVKLEHNQNMDRAGGVGDLI